MLEAHSSITTQGAGWRVFWCEACGMIWAETCRDHMSPSSTGCESCLEDGLRPIAHWRDKTLKVDQMGNLERFSSMTFKEAEEPE